MKDLLQAEMGNVTTAAGVVLDEFSRKTGVIRQVRYVVNQGCCRKENLLYT